MRVGKFCGGPLREAVVASSHHPDLAVTPRPPRDPVDHAVRIPSVVLVRGDLLRALILASCISHDAGVSAVRGVFEPLEVLGGIDVDRKLEGGRKAYACSGRADDKRREYRAAAGVN